MPELMSPVDTNWRRRCCLALVALVAVVSAIGTSPADTVAGPAGEGPFSDDFNGSTLDGKWTVVNPVGLGDASLDRMGHLLLSVPSGHSHDPWNQNRSLRVVQSADNADLSIDVKFASAPNQGYQMQGILVEQDEQNWLRFEVHHTGSGLKAFGARTSGGSSSPRYDVGVPSSPQVYLRVSRTANQWAAFHSVNGVDWVQVGAFTDSLAVSTTGVFVANHTLGGVTPSYTAVVDYFHVAGEEAQPEPPVEHTVTVEVQGEGSVAIDPNTPTISAGREVTLTAVAAPGHEFTGWSGAVSGTENPLVVVVDQDLLIIANFAEEPGEPEPPVEHTVTVEVQGEGSVAIDPNTPTVSAGSEVTLTAVAAPGYEFTGWSGAVSGIENPLVIVVDQDLLIIANFGEEPADPGPAPPQITDVAVSPAQDGAVVTWTTDMEATSLVAYGKTSAVDEGSVELVALTAAHQVTLEGLDAASLYYFRVTSASTHGLESQVNGTFSTLAGSGGGPVINIWGGPHQVFGNSGQPQTAINILGNVSSGEGVASLSYTINGSPLLPLTVGPDGRRLEKAGDFNVDIPYASLEAGDNEVAITATDTAGDSTTTVVTAVKQLNDFPVPGYTADWVSASRIDDHAQVVDGHWALSGGGLRTVTIGYDRLVALGDIGWRDYEVTTSLTVHALESTGPNSGPSPLVGMALRWQGHAGGSQPPWQWWPYGAFAWFEWNRGIDLIGNDWSPRATAWATLDLSALYFMKARVETIGGEDHYRFKMWRHDVLEPDWQLSIQYSGGTTAGSVVLIAHHADVTFGPVTIRPLSETPLAVSDVATIVDETEATLTWNTNLPATSGVSYGLTGELELGSVVSSELVTQHSVTLGGLESGTTYHFAATSVDADGNSVSSQVRSFTTGATFRSDAFEGSQLDSKWTVFDPLGGGAVTVANGHLALGVPAGQSHDPWDTNKSLRVMQPAANTDFVIHTKFDSLPAVGYQIQGLIIEQDSQNWLRFDVHHNGTSLHAFAASTSSGQSSTRLSVPLSAVSPVWIAVARSGSQWTYLVSTDGQDWTTLGAFSHHMTVNRVGPFAANHPSGSAPAFTALVDLFLNPADPLAPGDPGLEPEHTVSVVIEGEGTVVATPEQVTYQQGSELTLTAVPADGWAFAGWSGDIDSSENPLALAVDGNLHLTARFEEEDAPAPVLVIMDVAVSVSVNSVEMTWSTNIPASSMVRFGTTPSYELGETGSAGLTTSHAVTLADLDPETQYHFEVIAIAEDGQEARTPDATFVTSAASAPTVFFDDFNGSSLAPGWSVFDPVGDGSVSIASGRLQLAIPGGQSHDIWGTNRSLHVLRPVADVDFEIEVKFASVPTDAYQMQGILIQQDSQNWLRFEVHHDGGLRAFGASTTNGGSTATYNTGVGAGSEVHLRVQRSGSQWIALYSSDGIQWQTTGSFNRALTVSSAGVFAGNQSHGGSPAPAFTALIDTFSLVENWRDAIM